jgi:Uma2 family endonuclease
MADVPETAAIELPPDWVCEILSPRSAAIDRSVKREIYAREGVRWLWLVEPDTKTLEAFALDAGVWKLLGTWHADAAVRVAPFEAITLELAAFWRA